MALLDALRALTAFPPSGRTGAAPELPRCDLAELADVLDAHGLAPLASYLLENTRLAVSAPAWLRERLLPLYQGTVNDNVFKLQTLKEALREVDVAAVLLGGAAFLDWLYPHLAFRPVGDLRLCVRGEDGARFAAGLARSGFAGGRAGEGGHTASFTDGRLELVIQEGLVLGRGDDLGLFARAEPFPVLGRAAHRLAAEDGLLYTVGELALAGLHAPLLLFLDLRELLRQPELTGPARRAAILARAERAGLLRALHGALALCARFFPEVSEAAGALDPALPPGDRRAVDDLVERASDPAQLRLRRGAEAAAKRLVAPA